VGKEKNQGLDFERAGIKRVEGRCMARDAQRLVSMARLSKNYRIISAYRRSAPGRFMAI
jgi:hypothetical protein